jgi:uncharacterized membrane protein
MTADSVLSVITVADVLAVLGALAVTRPSLVPRSAASQLLALAGVVVLAYVVGGLLQPVVHDTGLGLDGPPLAVPAVWGAAGAILAVLIRTDPSLPFSGILRTIGTAGYVVAITAAADVGLQLLRLLDDTVPPRMAPAFRAVVLVAAALYIAQRLWKHVTAQQRVALRYQRNPPALLAFLAVVAVCVVFRVLTPMVHRTVLSWLAHILKGQTGTASVAAWAGLVLAVLVAGVVGFVLLRWWFTRVDGILDGRSTRPPPSPCVSGSPESLVDFWTLGRSGQQFVTTAPTKGEIDKVTTAENDPIRIYVGRKRPGSWYRPWGVDARVTLASDEIDRTGALQRRYVLIAAPTGSGSVTPAAVEAFEYLTHGNCATIVVQYASLPSWMALLTHRRYARKLYAELYRRIESKINRALRPTVVLFGESFGALCSQEALLKQSSHHRSRTELSDARLRVDAALWVGTPYVSRWLGKHQQVLVDRISPADGRFQLVDNCDDPVSCFGLRLLFERPGWISHSVRATPRTDPDGDLYTPNHKNAPLRLHPWRPGVTFCQVMADLVGAVSPHGTMTQPSGHDYGSLLPVLVRDLLQLEESELTTAICGALAERTAALRHGPLQPQPTRTPAAWRQPGITELRIHGVGGAPPEDTLNHPLAWQVAGDDLAGFYRCGSPEDPPASRWLYSREAYVWGGLTSTAWFRPLWILLLPFTLINVASWMAPAAPGADGPAPSWSQRVATNWIPRLHRLIALAMTTSFVLSFAGAGMFALGWSCPASTQCVGAKVVLHSPTLPILGSPSIPTPHLSGWRAVASVLPAFLALAAIWALGRISRYRYERWPHPESGSDRSDGAAAGRPLADPNFWRGRIPVARLQYLHTAVALAALTIALVWPAYLAVDGTRPALTVLGVLLVAAAAVFLLAVAITPFDRFVGRPGTHRTMAPLGNAGPEKGREGTNERAASTDAEKAAGVTVALQLLAFAALVLFAVAVLAVGTSWRTPRGPETTTGMTLLPGLGFSLGATFWAQALLVGLLGLALLPAARQARREAHDLDERGRRAGAGQPDAHEKQRNANEDRRLRRAYRPFAKGYAPALVAGLAVLVGGAFSSGVLLIGVQPNKVVLPSTVVQGAVVVVASLLGVILALGGLLVGRALMAGIFGGDVVAGYGRGGEAGIKPGEIEQPWVTRRRAQIAKRWATGWMVDWAFIPIFVVVTIGTLGFALSVTPVSLALQDSVAEPSMWLVTVLATTLLGYTYAALRDPKRRRLIGTLWDVCTFWPRAAHPFAAPCYAERAVPDVVERIRALVRQPADQDVFPYASDGVVVVGYSQGSVLAAAAVQQLGDGEVERAALLTCASPLRRLYARAFPAYVNAETVRPREQGDPTPPQELPPLPRLAHSCRWINVYRKSDFIGSWIQRAPLVDATSAEDADAIDRLIRDPRAFGCPVGDLALPKTSAHGGYLADPHLIHHIDQLTTNLRAHLNQMAMNGRERHYERPQASRTTVHNGRGVWELVGQSTTPPALLALAIVGWAGWWRDHRRLRS